MILNAQPTTTFLGACRTCTRPVRASDPYALGRYTTLACRDCGQPVRGERLYATVTAQPCHGACMGAWGPSCSCGCGGLNHGRLYEQRGEATESAVAAYRAAIAKQEAEAARRAQARRRAFEAWAAEHRDVTDYLADPERFDPFGEEPSDFLYDMARLLQRGRTLSDRQLHGVRRWIAGRARIAQRKAEEAAAAKPVPTGDKVQVTGTVVYTNAEDNRYGPGVTYRMLLKGDGWKLWSTIPRGLVTATDRHTDLRGRTIRLTATITAKPDDPTTGNAKRPRNAALLDPAPTT